ncbi:MAG: DHH family phosphoesterase, partial [Gemmatimonadota bacterium]
MAKRVHDLRTFARGTEVVPILVQDDPDPDAMASALGIQSLLRRSPDQSPVVSLGDVTRPENQRMAELLKVRVVRVSRAELDGFRRVIAVDTQPAPVESATRFAVIDHHPVREGYSADFVDIRPETGAASTMITQYLRVDDERRITSRLAAALLYGIRTDTEVLLRGTSPEDVEAYAFLQGVADHELLRKIGRPAFAEDVVRSLGRALAGLEVEADVAVAYAGRLDERAAHVLSNLADFCLSVEGVTWSAAAGRVNDHVVVNIRRTGGSTGAGELARALVETDRRLALGG